MFWSKVINSFSISLYFLTQKRLKQPWLWPSNTAKVLGSSWYTNLVKRKLSLSRRKVKALVFLPPPPFITKIPAQTLKSLLAICAPIALFAFGFSGYYNYKNITQVNTHRAFTQAVVTDKEWHSGWGLDKTFTYRFTAANGRQYIELTDITNNPNWIYLWDQTEVGDKVAIVYDSQNPTKTFMTTAVPDARHSQQVLILCALGELIALPISFRYFFT